MLVVESSQPRHASLTNLALAIVENAVYVRCGMLCVRRGGDLGK